MYKINVSGKNFLVAFEVNFVDFGKGSQMVMFCLIRPEGSLKTYLGHTIKNPTDKSNRDIARSYAFKRAVWGTRLIPDVFNIQMRKDVMRKLDPLFRKALFEERRKLGEVTCAE